MNQKGFVNITLIVVLVVVLASAVGYFTLVRNNKSVTQQSPTFNSFAAVTSEIKTFKGDKVCDTRIRETEVNPEDCVAELILDSRKYSGSEMFTGTLRVKNVRPELQNLKPQQIRCYADVFSKNCVLIKEKEEGDETIYRFTAENNDSLDQGFIPVGVEIKLGENFHIAAIDWFNAYNPNGYNYKKWGGNYRAVLVPLKIGTQEIASAEVERVKTILNNVASILNREAQRFGNQNSISFTFENYPVCSVEPDIWGRTIAGSASLCNLETAEEAWYRNTFTILISPQGTCPNFQVITPGVPPDPIPTTYGQGGDVCIAVGNASEQFITEGLLHEFLHGFGAADHYDWIQGKDPNYQCNVSSGVKVCPVAAQEIGWR